MNLSKHFTLEELTKSHTAIRLNIPNTTEDPILIQNGVLLCENILEPIREAFGAFTPNSCFRDIPFNRAIGSSDTSKHVTFQAADVEIIGIDNYEFAVWAEANLKFRKLILENYIIGQPNSGWVHISYDPNNLLQKSLTFSNKLYHAGLVK